MCPNYQIFSLQEDITRRDIFIEAISFVSHCFSFRYFIDRNMPKGLDLKLIRAYTGSPDHSTILITIFESHKGKYSKYNKYNISLLHCGLQGRNQSLLQPGSGRWKREEGGEEGGEGGEDEDEDEDEVDVLRRKKNDFGKRDGKREKKIF